MFYPDCGFGILKMASPNLVLFKISQHLLSSASPTISLQPAHSVTHLPDTWHALSLWKQEQPVLLLGRLQGPLTTAMLCLTPGFQQPLVSSVSGVLPSLLLV